MQTRAEAQATGRPLKAAGVGIGARPIKADNDRDGDGGADDNLWGHAASAADRRDIVALVKRYYAIAAAGDGARACAILYSLFAEEVPETYGEPPGDPALRGKTCAAVMSKVFKQRRRQLIQEAPSLKVIGVRIRGLRGLALLSFRGIGERDILVHREKRLWRIDALLDGGLG
jgi:hypothetical protein